MVSEEGESQDLMRCKANPEEDEVCSGRGICRCGTCVCSDPVSSHLANLVCLFSTVFNITQSTVLASFVLLSLSILISLLPFLTLSSSLISCLTYYYCYTMSVLKLYHFSLLKLLFIMFIYANSFPDIGCVWNLLQLQQAQV